jgi:hypothetical protein
LRAERHEEQKNEQRGEEMLRHWRGEPLHPQRESPYTC